MDTRTDVNRQASINHAADNEAVATEAMREPAASASQTNASQTSEAAHVTGQTDQGPRRESVDPMRLTDRYRLVHPMTAGF